MSTNDQSFKSIAVFGATGDLGPFLVNALVESKAFDTIKVLTREQSAKEKPEVFQALEARGIKVYVLDLNDEDAVAGALEGTDAVVSAVAGAHVAIQSVWIRAAAKAGVKRFIPSEYGLNNQTEGTESVFKAKRDIQEQIENIGLEFTYVFTAVFADEALIAPFGFDIKNGTLRVVGNTNAKFNVTYRRDIASFIVEILKNPSISKNKALQVSSDQTSFDEIAEIFKANGSPLKLSYIPAEEARRIIDANPTELSSFFLLILLKVSEGKVKFERIDNGLFPNVATTGIEAAVKEAIVSAKA